jgi:hypothetical protein
VLYLGLEQGDGSEWRTEQNGSRRNYYFWYTDELVAALGEVGLDTQDLYVEHVAN